jgi:glucan biosynthesis protein
VFRTIYLFAGFRLHARLNQPDYFDELMVFQGSCYRRAFGIIQRYGLSSRCIALNTGIEGTPEEIPALLLGICILRNATERAIESDWRWGNGG